MIYQEMNLDSSQDEKNIPPMIPSLDSNSVKVLLVEDNLGDAFLVKKMLTGGGLATFDFHQVDRLSKAKEFSNQQVLPNVILLDLNLPDSVGESTFLSVLESFPNSSIIVFTGMSERKLGQKLLGQGAYGFLRKDELTESVLFNTIYACLQRKASEDELRSLRDLAEEANEAKTQFLGKMSHELRTPLSSILGFSELMGDESDLVKVRGYLDRISSNAKYLLGLVNDLLDLSKVQSGHLEISKREFSLENEIEELYESALLQATKKSLKVDFKGLSNLPKVIKSDRTRIKQIMSNLLGNAIKFSSEGLILVEMSSKNDALSFVVKDQGPGIPLEHIDSLFQPYAKFAKGAVNDGGSGLGLAIAKNLAIALGGDVKLVETSPEGTSFEFTLSHGLEQANAENLFAWPSDENHASQRFSETPTLLGNERILVVEDSPDNQFLINMMLSKFGAKSIEMVGTGSEGIEKASSGEFDIVLLDVTLPDINGLEVARTLRKSGMKSPIIALTAHAFKEYEKKCLDAGCDEFLTKPVNFRLLAERISKLAAVSNA